MTNCNDSVEDPEQTEFDPEVFYDAENGEPEHLENCQLEFVAGTATCAVKEPVDDVRIPAFRRRRRTYHSSKVIQVSMEDDLSL